MMQPNQPAAPMPPQPGAQPGAAAPQGDGQQEAPAICIQMQPDGTYLVYSDADGPDNGQPAKDIDGALQIAKGMLEGDTDADDAGGASDSDADDMFQSGFNSARGLPLGK